MSQDASPPLAAIQRVPVFQTMRAAYTAVFSSLGLLVRAAALPLILSLVITGLSFTSGVPPFLSFILIFVGFVPYTLFGVAWHRLTLLGPVAGAPDTFPSWRRRHWRFLSYVAFITGFTYLISVPLTIAVAQALKAGSMTLSMALVLFVAAVAFFILLSYVMMRVSFVFPAAAVDENYTLAHSWSHTRNQGFRLMATLFVTAFPMLIAFGIVSSLLLPDIAPISPDQAVSPESIFRQSIAENALSFGLIQLLLAALNYIVMALMVSAVSIAFQHCTGWVPAAQVEGQVMSQDEDETGTGL